MASGPQPGDPPQPGLVNQGEAMLKAMDREIVTLRRQVRRNPPRSRYVVPLQDTFSPLR